jgi:hypothetical protein
VGNAFTEIGAVAPASVISRFFPARYLFRAHLLQFCLGAIAAIGAALGKHLLDDFAVAVETPRLVEGSLVVIEARPFQAVEDLLNGLGGRALEVRVLDAQHVLAAVPTCIQPTEKRGPKSADVQETGWTGSESGADGHELRESTREAAVSAENGRVPTYRRCLFRQFVDIMRSDAIMGG